MGARKATLALAVLALLAGSLLAGGCESVSGGAEDTAAGAPVEVSTTAELPAGPEGTGGSLLGKWHNATTGETLEFRADGTVLGTAGDQAGLIVTYLTEENLLTIDAAGGLLTSVYYSVDGNTLTLTDPVTGEPGTLQRVD